ncbi:DUF2314 domain-containing protein [Octadecabacter sp. CECT 8868]|uniref:DUF2314 domain-containing protein n=1 Tax=Octadecabacter algicola TaxID=2909342 RepID=UPI001F3B4BD2|nr:DUF2314 domain-containing protein [Octadecabacter algicola]MCF2904376.1 DUF2314 domain-containing protein [Octadecabacter algicola]
MLRFLIAGLLLAAPNVALTQEGDPITNFATDDTAMSEAQEVARESLPLFLVNGTDSDGYGLEGSAVKVAFDLGGNDAEVIWVAPFLWDGDQLMMGLLANQPNFLGNLNAGDRVDFDISMVRDWSLPAPNGQIYGNFTTRVMLPHLDAATAAELNAALTKNPVPTDW